jgi:hypothetical protein
MTERAQIIHAIPSVTAKLFRALTSHGLSSFSGKQLAAVHLDLAALPWRASDYDKASRVSAASQQDRGIVLSGGIYKMSATEKALERMAGGKNNLERFG